MTTKPLRLDVNEQIECAQTLASRFYTDPQILEIEREKIFRHTWQLVGTLDQACGEEDCHRLKSGFVSTNPETGAQSSEEKGNENRERQTAPASESGRYPGRGKGKTISDLETFFTAEVAGEPVIVVRDKAGILRAFSNVCRHRAGPIALGSGCRNVLRCQYHGWTYTLDGRLIGTPDVEGVEFFDRSTMGMVPLRLETWENFIFVNFDANAEPLPAFLGNIPEQTRGFRFDGLQLAERRDYVLQCNWKVYVDNYLEGYHIPIAHPGLMREIDYSQYRTETYKYYSQQFAPIRAIKPSDSGERFY